MFYRVSPWNIPLVERVYYKCKRFSVSVWLDNKRQFNFVRFIQLHKGKSSVEQEKRRVVSLLDVGVNLIVDSLSKQQIG